MNLNCVSWNVRGLESLDRKYIVRRFLILEKQKYLVLLQETKVVGFTLENNLKFIWKESCFFNTNHEKGKGGVFILLSKKWSPYVTNQGTSPCNRVVWVTMDKEGFVFGICSIYAPNDHRERATI